MRPMEMPVCPLGGCRVGLIPRCFVEELLTKMAAAGSLNDVDFDKNCKG